MYQGDNLTTLKDNEGKKIKKRKLHKHKKRIVNNDTDLSSDSETETCNSPADLDLKFSLSQTSQTFSEIFSQAQATLREHPSKKREKNCSRSELPVIQWTSNDTNPQQRRSRKKAKSTKRRNKSDDHKLFTVANATTSKGSRENGNVESNSLEEVQQRLEIDPYRLAVAELDTDTELEQIDLEAASTHTTHSNTVPHFEEIILLSSDEDTPLLHHRDNKIDLSSRSMQTHRSWSPASVVTISSSSRSSSPLPEIIDDSPVINPSSENEKLEASYNLGDMRIRVLYRGDLHEFDGNEDWDVERVREKLSELTNVPDSELLIYTENEKKMEDGKSLKEYDIKLGEILEALRRCTENHIPQGEGVIKLKFQKEGLKRPIHLSVLKYRNLKEIRSQVAKLIQADEKKLFFRVDGEVVDLLKTPDDLELEDDFCVDIFEKH